MRAKRNGMPLSAAYPRAAVTPESGTGTTRSASTGASRASCAPRFWRLVHRAAKHLAVRTREIHMLEDATGLRGGGGVEPRRNPLRPHDDQFPGPHFALVHGADQIEGAGFGGKHDRVLARAFLGRN